MVGGFSHDGAQRRGGDKAPGAGIRGSENREQRSNGPEIEDETHRLPFVLGENQESTSPTEATEKEATEVRPSVVSVLDRKTKDVQSGSSL